MNLKVSVEDINEFFNFCDDKGINRITKTQFVNSITFIQSKLGGYSHIEQ